MKNLPYVLAAVLLFAGCARLEEKKPWKKRTGDFPVLEMRDSVTLDMYNNSHLVWVLHSKYMRKMARTGNYFTRPVAMTVYDSLGKETAWVKADSGTADEEVKFVTLWGRVSARSRDGASVWADSLVWNLRDQRVRTDGRVTVVSEENDTLSGYGFTADDRLERWKILSDVRGVIQKVEERMGE